MGLSNARLSGGDWIKFHFFLFFFPRVMFNLKLLFGGNTGHNADCVCGLIYDRAVPLAFHPLSPTKMTYTDAN